MNTRKTTENDDDASFASLSISSELSDVTIKSNSTIVSEGDMTCITCGYTPCSLIAFEDQLKQTFEMVETPTKGVEWNNKEKRFQSYSHFTKLLYGPLGKGERIPLPVCVEKHIRDRFPEENGNYVGYKKKKSRKN